MLVLPRALGNVDLVVVDWLVIVITSLQCLIKVPNQIFFFFFFFFFLVGWCFTGQVQRGELVVRADVAPSLARIFTTLYDAKFPIERMAPLENYGGDSDASLAANNTAVYNCRRPDQTNSPIQKSPHANGRAIDINPARNPWQDPRCTCWSPTGKYSARTPGTGKILENGVVWQAFKKEGWFWQNIKVADYMHFDTGYPSVTFTGKGRNGATA